MIAFVKTHALGNDFILVEGTKHVPPDYADLARRICDRHFGIGGDGLILWNFVGDRFNIRIFNQDGSEAECSGNGLRCAAAYLIESGRWPKDEIEFGTISGAYLLKRLGREYEADMGEPKLAPKDIPFVPPVAPAVPMDHIVNYPIDAGGRSFAITACSTGNPHCSLFVDKLDDAYVESVGPLLEKHRAFPNRTNVEFIHVLGARRRLLERVRNRFMRGDGCIHPEQQDAEKSDSARESGPSPCRMAGERPFEINLNGEHRRRRDLFGSLMSNELFDVVIVGAGPAGLAAGIEAKKCGLKYVVFDKGGITNSILHFPIQMIFFTTPELLEIGGVPLVSEREKPSRNEALKYYRKVVGMYQLNVHQYEEVVRIYQLQPHVFQIETTEAAYHAHNVVLSTGYYDNPNLMSVPGEDLPHVSHYYTEAHPFYDRDVAVIGGKNSAAEAALDLFRGGARVSLIHRGTAMGQTVKYWVRPDIENRFKNGEITPYFNAKVIEITKHYVRISQNGDTRNVSAEQVFALTGYHSSQKFFDQLGVPYDAGTLRTEYDSTTFETKVPGVYLAGSVIGGRINGEIFIENGRFHGEVLIKSIANMK
jgi:thioredoxin reductase (NADPH)